VIHDPRIGQEEVIVFGLPRQRENGPGRYRFDDRGNPGWFLWFELFISNGSRRGCSKKEVRDGIGWWKMRCLKWKN